MLTRAFPLTPSPSPSWGEGSVVSRCATVFLLGGQA